jgi:hypothetical protein
LLSLVAAAICDRTSSSWLLRTSAPFRAGCRGRERCQVELGRVRCAAVLCSAAHLACAQLAHGICDAGHEPAVTNATPAELDIGLVGNRLELLCLAGLITHCIVRVILLCLVPALGCWWPLPRCRAWCWTLPLAAATGSRGGGGAWLVAHQPEPGLLDMEAMAWP